jgi:hypothetical protein
MTTERMTAEPSPAVHAVMEAIVDFLTLRRAIDFQVIRSPENDRCTVRYKRTDKMGTYCLQDSPFWGPKDRRKPFPDFGDEVKCWERLLAKLRRAFE